MSLDGLLVRAAKLSGVEIAAPPRVVGRNTTHSLQSGLVYGYASLADGSCNASATSSTSPVQ